MIDPNVIRNRLSASPSRRRNRRRGGAAHSPAAASITSLAAWTDAGLPRAAPPASGQARGPFASACGAFSAGGACASRRLRGQRALALDETAGDIIGDRGGDGVDRLAFGDQHPAVACVLMEPVGAPVVRHVDEGDHVDEQTRMIAPRQRQIKHVDVRRRLRDDGLERAFEQRQTAHFNLAQIRNRLGALGVLDPRLPDRGCEVGQGGKFGLGLVVHRPQCRPRLSSKVSANPADRKPFDERSFSGTKSSWTVRKRRP